MPPLLSKKQVCLWLKNSLLTSLPDTGKAEKTWEEGGAGHHAKRQVAVKLPKGRGSSAESCLKMQMNYLNPKQVEKYCSLLGKHLFQHHSCCTVRFSFNCKLLQKVYSISGRSRVLPGRGQPTSPAGVTNFHQLLSTQANPNRTKKSLQ